MQLHHTRALGSTTRILSFVDLKVALKKKKRSDLGANVVILSALWDRLKTFKLGLGFAP